MSLSAKVDKKVLTFVSSVEANILKYIEEKFPELDHNNDLMNEINGRITLMKTEMKNAASRHIFNILELFEQQDVVLSKIPINVRLNPIPANEQLVSVLEEDFDEE